MKPALLTMMLLVSTGLSGQPSKVDSLTSAADRMKDDTAKVMALIDLSDLLLNENRQAESLQVLQKARALATHLNHRRGKERTLRSLTNLSPPVVSTADRIRYHKDRLEICEGLKDTACMAECEGGLGLRHFSIGDYPQALAHYQRAIKLNGRLKDTMDLAGVHYNLCTLYARMDSTGPAKLHILEFMRLQELRKDSAMLIAGMASLAGIHAMKKEYDSALELHQLVLKFHEARNDTAQFVFVLGNIGNVLREQADRKAASAVFERVSDIYAAKPDLHPMTMGQVLTQYGQFLLDIGDLKRAEKTLNEALELSTLVTSKRLMRDCHQLLADLAERKGDLGAALRHHRLFTTYKDSLMNEEATKQLSDLRTRYDVEHKDEEILLLQVRNLKEKAETQAERNKRLSTLAVSCSAIVMLLGGGTFAMRNRKARHRAALARQELHTRMVQTDLERIRLTPHFVKNALSNVEQLISLGRAEEAQRYTERFSRLMSKVLASSRHQYVTLAEELDMMHDYLSLEADRIGNSLRWSVSVADGLNTEEIELPPMVLQPLLENALKHGIDLKSGTAELKLGVRKENGRIRCSIEDNGKGPSPALPRGEGATTAESNTSQGLRITRERLQLFSSLRHADARLEFEHVHTGTKAVVSFTV